MFAPAVFGDSYHLFTFKVCITNIMKVCNYSYVVKFCIYLQSIQEFLSQETQRLKS